MIMLIFRIARKLFVKCVSLLICNSRKNRRKILSKKNLSNIFALTANVRKNCANLHLNNCVEEKCKKEFCVKPESTISSNKNKIPKAKEPHVVQTLAKPNVPSLVMLLQAIGFQLRQFEVSKEENTVPKESINVTIQCGSSQMKAVLEMHGIECQCPSSTVAKEGSLWSICGTGPTHDDSESSSKYEESGTNLLPEIPKGVNNVVRDVVYRLFKIMNTPTELTTESSSNDLNVSALENAEVTETPNLKKTESIERIFRSRTQPAIPSARVLSTDKKFLTSKNLFPSSVNAKDEKTAKVANGETEIREDVLQRQKTWHLDLDRESGTILPNLIDSASPSDQRRISRGSSVNAKMEFTDYVFTAYRNLDTAVQLINYHNPVTSSTLSLYDDFFDNPPLIPSATSSASPSPKGSRPASACSIPSRSSVATSVKSLPVKPPTRRSVPAQISKKSTEKSTASVGEITPMRRKSTISILPQKTIPQQKLSVPKTTSNSSMNSSNLNDKVALNAKRRVSPSNVKSSTLTPKRNTFGPNTSFRGPSTLPNPKTTSQTSKGTPGTTKFGFAKAK